MTTWMRAWLLAPAFGLGAVVGAAGMWAAQDSGKQTLPDPPQEAPPTAQAPPAEATSMPGSPRFVTPTPGSGQGRHPTFDCASFDALGQPPKNRGKWRTIAELTSEKGALEGKEVRVFAKVMAVYPNIMGTHWVHLCDTQNGDVLMATSYTWAHPGASVFAVGRLTVDRKIGGAYSFPLLIEHAEFGEAGGEGSGTDL